MNWKSFNNFLCFVFFFWTHLQVIQDHINLRKLKDFLFFLWLKAPSKNHRRKFKNYWFLQLYSKQSFMLLNYKNHQLSSAIFKRVSTDKVSIGFLFSSQGFFWRFAFLFSLKKTVFYLIQIILSSDFVNKFQFEKIYYTVNCFSIEINSISIITLKTKGYHFKRGNLFSFYGITPGFSKSL